MARKNKEARIRSLKFKCLVFDEFETVEADDISSADKKTDFKSSLIIQGTAASIGARRIEEIPQGADHFTVKGRIQNGTKCTIVVGDPVIIRDATFLKEEVNINGATFLKFLKHGTIFWCYEYDVIYTYVAGQRV